MKLSDAIYKDNSQIKNIIFDWGGVISNLNFKRCVREFDKLGIKNFDAHYNFLAQNEIYRNFEKGFLSSNEFRNALRALMPLHVTDKEIDYAWMSMLGDLPKERWDLLQKIKSNYRTFLLSNTNPIHVENYFNYLFDEFGFKGYAHLFEKVYLSYEIGMRKPDPEIFQFVLKDSNLHPRETLLIDDSLQNIEAAEKLYIQTYYLEWPITLTDLFANGKN